MKDKIVLLQYTTATKNHSLNLLFTWHLKAGSPGESLLQIPEVNSQVPMLEGGASGVSSQATVAL